MKRAKYIFRAVFFVLAVLLLIDLNRKTDNNVQTIADFKFKTIEKLRTDSLDAKHKADLLLKETTKFIDNSSHVRNGIHYLLALLGLWVAVELGFLIVEKRNYTGQEIK
jgi:hypothetical protein